MSEVKTVPKEVISGQVEGTIWSTEGIVLARSPTHWLVWFKGHTAYIDRGTGSVYSPGNLILQQRGRGWHGNWRILEGGRLTVGRVAAAFYGESETDVQATAAINAAFGEQRLALLAAVEAKQSLLVDGGGDAFRASRSHLAKVAAKHAGAVAKKVGLGPSPDKCRQCGGDLRRYLGVMVFKADDPVIPNSFENCQTFTNHQVVECWGFNEAEHAGKVKGFRFWEEGHYRDPDFCQNDCAAEYGRRAAKILGREALEAIPLIDDDAVWN